MAIVRTVRVRRVNSARPRVIRTAAPRQGARVLSNEIIQKFNPSMLELGDISAPCKEKEAVAAVFDLTGFTAFCNQVDSYLAIPRFLNDFLDWFFTNVKQRTTELNQSGQSVAWAGLPMLVKFLGDGLLVLWNCRMMTEEHICRLAGSLYEVCLAYRTDFYPRMSMVVNKPPNVLRCGVGRGRVFSIGNNKDYVGHCINTASRLSHVGSLSFCFPHRGFQVQEHMPAQYRKIFIAVKASIRGVGEDELVWVAKEEYENMGRENNKVLPAVKPAGNYDAGRQNSAATGI